MSVQTVTIYPESVISSSRAVNPENILGYNLSYVSADGYDYLGDVEVEFGAPGFSGSEEILEIRLSTEQYSSSGNNTSVPANWWKYVYDSAGSGVHIYYPPGIVIQGNYVFTTHISNPSGVTYRRDDNGYVFSAYSTSNPWGIVTEYNINTSNDPADHVANASVWQNKMRTRLYINNTGYSGNVTRLRRARIEIDFIPGNVVPVRDAGLWKDSTPYAKHSGVWKEGAPYAKHSGIWKPTV